MTSQQHEYDSTHSHKRLEEEEKKNRLLRSLPARQDIPLSCKYWTHIQKGKHIFHCDSSTTLASLSCINNNSNNNNNNSRKTQEKEKNDNSSTGEQILSFTVTALFIGIFVGIIYGCQAPVYPITSPRSSSSFSNSTAYQPLSYL